MLLVPATGLQQANDGLTDLTLFGDSLCQQYQVPEEAITFLEVARSLYQLPHLTAPRK